MGSKKRSAKPKIVLNANTILVPIRIPKAQLRKLKEIAKRHGDSSLSAWLRHAGLRYRLKRGEIVETIPRPSGFHIKKKR